MEKNKTASVAIFCLLCLVLVQRGILGAPMWGESFELKQPDGATAQVRIWGDEFYQVVESLDGYTLVRDPASGVICYATVSADDQELVSTGTKMLPAAPAGLGINKHLRIAQSSVQEKVSAARARFREGKLLVGGLPGVPEPAAPSTGNLRALCLIIDFPDAAGTISPSEIDDYCNQVGYSGYGNNGSVRDYFYDVSDGNLVYTNYVPSQYYTAIHNKSYYDNPAESMGPKARELVMEALNDLDSRGFDFSQYDSNGDGYVDGVNAFYAGNCGSGWSKGLWPHSWTVSFSADGVSTFKYQVTDMRSSLSLGTFCHENGHMICYWPDLYDYDYDSAGVGRFCLMAYGGAGSNPVEPCAYLKAAAGWSSVSTAAGIHTLTAGVNSCFMFPHPSWSGEYYLVENRQATGRDSSLPDSGIAIWYVDEYGSNNNQQMLSWSHYECTLVQADGDWDLENYRNYGDSTDLWAAPGYTTCGPSTNPNTSWWSGDASDLLITNISAPGPSMTFTVGGEPYALSVQSTPDTGAAITGTYPGTTNYAASVSAATAVTVTAPWEHAGKFFLRWKDSGGTTLTYHGAYSFTMNADAAVIAEYGDVTEFYINDATPEPPIAAGDDANPGTSPDAPMATIQTLLDRYPNIGTGCRVHVSDGTYVENVRVNSVHSGLTLQGAGRNVTTIDGNQNGSCLRLASFDEGTISGFTITNGNSDIGGGIYCYSSSPTITNNTITANTASFYGGGGMACHLNSSATITNTILWGNTALTGPEIYLSDNSTLTVTYSDVEGGESEVYVGSGCTLIWGDGNIDADPLFADPDNDDYHLKSARGRWNPATETWVTDTVTSPCIDAGDPGSDYSNEPEPNGGRINMGAYGNTAQASKSPPAAISDLAASLTAKLTVASATSSTVLYNRYVAANAIDGNPNTFWSSSMSPVPRTERLILHLGSTQAVGKVRLLPRAAYPELLPGDFTIDVSKDGDNWTQVISETGYVGQSNVWYEKSFGVHFARYVRIAGPNMLIGDGRIQYYLQIAEFEVYKLRDAEGSKLNVRSATSSGNLYNRFVAANAIDGNPNTLWSSTMSPVPRTEYLALDMGAAKTIGMVRLLPRATSPELFPGDFTIDVSTDGDNWTQAVAEAGYTGQSNVWYERSFLGTSARYVRIAGPSMLIGDGRIQYYLQIAEFEVYAAGTEVVKLSWTATGDGGYVGTAASYEARYSTQEITTQEIWDAATGVTGEPSPEIAATSQSMTISTSALPADARVYFAIRTTNHAGIESDLSNSPYVDISITYRVFILAGQSNMVGLGLLYQLPADLQTLPDNVELHAAALDSSLHQVTGQFGPEIMFSHEISRAWPQEHIIVIKYAVYGATMADWAPDWDPERAATMGHTAFGPLYRKLMDYIPGVLDGRIVEFAGVLWMQGEGDAAIPLAAEQYAENLQVLIQRFRQDLGVADLPFILGRINPPADRYPQVAQVREAQAQAENAILRTKMVSTEGLTKHADHVHYDTRGQMELGIRFAQAYLELTEEQHNVSGLANSPYVDTPAGSGSDPIRRPAVRQIIPGDANGDCRVNIIDLIFIRGRLGQDVHTADNWKADVNGDGTIDIMDQMLVRKHLGAKCR
ncbi:MAG: M6 family metalloprotease domain-containing protein [Planctomycetes bacterium]|nr:M6 family metalloprotease domain-containing protein [Planctomycetota bacterium]